MPPKTNHIYSEIYPSPELEDFISLYFSSQNTSDTPNTMTICPDGYFKLIIQLKEGEISAYFLTGLWMKEVEIVIPPGVITYGVKFRILAPEYILKREIRSILNSVEQLDVDYLGIKGLHFDSFMELAKQLEAVFLKQLPPPNEIRANRLRLSQLLYGTYGDLQASEVADQIYWSQREINRYLNTYMGISLKKYLNVQKCYRAYLHIREGEFFPEKGFYDQAHFIREVKKHTGHTPSILHKRQNDQFIQLKNIKKL
ncbi:MAG: DUF6597 domain-containing transcriptional factor [Bacteroidota bacterium]